MTPDPFEPFPLRSLQMLRAAYKTSMLDPPATLQRELALGLTQKKACHTQGRKNSSVTIIQAYASRAPDARSKNMLIPV